MLDVIIIGAGMTGLSAALELKKLGYSYRIFEAMPHMGGRGASLVTQAGTPVDLGGHWLHGADNPLKALIERYGIDYEKDKNRHLRIYKDGEMREEKGTKWLEECVDKEKAAAIESGEMPDQPLSFLASDEDSREILKDFALMWNGLEPPLEPSAKEFLGDKSTPGGLLPEHGVGELFLHMQREIGPEHIVCNASVSTITSNAQGVQVEVQGNIHEARKAFFTGSLGVLTSALVTFNPRLTHDFSGFVMGKMNKIILELAPEFFIQREIPEHLALELLDATPSHFCHISAPLVTLFVSGEAAGRVERLQSMQAITYVKDIIAPVEEMQGFEAYVVGEPIITHWVGNPYTQGAYSACLPGGRRSWPVEQGNIMLCGDMFDPNYFSSLAGAYRSGLAAARLFDESERLLK